MLENLFSETMKVGGVIKRCCKPKKYAAENIRTPPFSNPTFTFLVPQFEIENSQFGPN